MFPNWLHQERQSLTLEMPEQMLSVVTKFVDPILVLPKESQLDTHLTSYLGGICHEIVEIDYENRRFISRLKRSLPDYFVKQWLSIGNSRIRGV
jgi:hypothetical protein